MINSANLTADEKQQIFQTKEEMEKYSKCTPNNSAMCNEELPEDDKVDDCPLFATGLPSNFSSNPTLAAIASLLEDDDENVHTGTECVSQPLPTAGGGKATRRGARNRWNIPYSKPEKKKPSNTVKEIELFMKMWKP